MDRGYMLIFEPTHPNAHKYGYVAEQAKVMAAMLGRPMKRYEEVHRSNSGTALVFEPMSGDGGREVPSWQSGPVL
jgi:hypothetical protein